MLRNYKTIQLGSLKSFNANARTHSPEQINQIVDSIKEFGFTNPLLVDENNQIIVGHGRAEAAKQLGLDELPCLVLDDLTEIQKAALVIADNKIAMNAGWDESILKSQFDLLKDNGFSLNLTGFNPDELALFYPSPLPLALCDDNELPQVVENSVINPGDLWTLGHHRLLCGDSTNALDVDKLLGGQLPNTMVTDPPYGVKYEAGWRAARQGRNKSIREESSNIKNDDRADWYDAYVLFPGNVAYVWHAGIYTDVFKHGLERAGFEIKQQIIWNKNHFSLGRSDYHWKHEPCWYAVKEGRAWLSDRKQTTVWDVTAVNYDGNKADRTNHPTQKPIELYMRSIMHHTNPGEYVYDPFAGSGTLMVACEKSQRRALMIEIDPKYVEVILQRYKNYTGNEPVRDDGIKYGDLRNQNGSK